MLLSRGKTGMYQTPKNTLFTAAAGVVPSRTTQSAGRRHTFSAARPVKVRTRFGLVHLVNTLRYVLFGTGSYAPPIGKFNV